MATITITSQALSSWTHGGSTASLRIFPLQSFFATSGAEVLQGNVSAGTGYQTVSCTVSGTTLTIPSFAINSTTDSSNPNARYIAYLYDDDGVKRELWLGGAFSVPHAAASTTWEAVDDYNRAVAIPRPAREFYDKDQVDALFLTAPANAVSTTDSRLMTDLSDYDDTLAGAVAAIGAAEVILNISEEITLSTNVTIPANVLLDFSSTGKINIGAGVRLTIGNMRDAGSRQVFELADSTAEVFFSNGAVPHMNTAWIAGAASGADVTNAVNNYLASAAAAGGICRIYIPNIVADIGGVDVLGSSVVIYGNGNFNSGSNGYGTTLRASGDASYLFKIGESTYSCRFKNITLDAAAHTVDALVLFEGASPNTSGDFSFTNVTFDSGAVGVRHNSTASSWQLAQVGFYQCIFQNCAASLKTNSVNAGMTFINTNFAVPASGIAYQCDGGGCVKFMGCEFAATPSSGAKVCVISASHGGLTFDACQDEGFDKFIQNDASDISGIINITGGSLVQSKIELNQSCKLNITDSNLMSYAIQGAATGAVAQVTKCHIRSVSVNDGVTAVSPPVLLGAGSGVRAAIEDLTDNAVFIRRYPQRFISPLSDLGAPSTPVLSVAHITNGTDEDKILIRLGRMDTSEVFDYYYDIYRDHGTGYLTFAGNQADPNKAFSFNAALFIPDEAYDAATWNANLSVPTKNAIRDKIEDILDGATFTGDVIVPDEAYDATAWNGSLEAPTKNAVRDKIETLDAAKADLAGATFTGAISGTAISLSGNAAAASVTVGGGTAITKIVKGTVAVDPASINATTVSSQTFTLTGAAAGDSLVLNPPAAGLTAGLLVLQSFVSAADTATIVFYNTTGAPIDEASASWTYTLIRS